MNVNVVRVKPNFGAHGKLPVFAPLLGLSVIDVVAFSGDSAGWEDVVRRTIYTLHPTQYEVITAAIEDVQGSADHPAQTILGVTGLAVPGLLIELEVTVRLPG
ncbi:MAG: hypothetical protein AB7E59_10315 [Pusillimonas sp.]